MENIINTDTDPAIPNDTWKVEDHRRSGMLDWKEDTSDLYLDESQHHKVYGSDLRRSLKMLPTLNANVLDFLLKHQELIPESWKMDSKKRPLFVFFWGTIYRGSEKNLYVRYLFFTSAGWKTRHRDLRETWHADNPAALLLHR